MESSDYIVHNLSYSDAVRGYAHVAPSTGGGWSFSTLRHINYFLQNLYRCEDEAVRKKYEGVGRFWRAYFYFSKLQLFGDLPWYDQVLNSDDDQLLYKERDSRDVIIKHIIDDLDVAAKQLPEVGENKYHICRYTALALKARACLYEGTFRKYHAGTAFNPNNLPYADLLQQAASAALEVMQSGKYQLYTEGARPYYDYFVGTGTASEKETILSRSYGLATHDASAFALVASKGSAGFTRAFALTYLDSDGTRFTDKADYLTQPFTEETKNRDPRMAQTFLTQNFTYKDGTQGLYRKNLSVTGYPVVKFIEGSEAISGSHVDMPVFRLGEVYLNYAEALAEAGTITQNDLDISINKLRDRVQEKGLKTGEQAADALRDIIAEEMTPEAEMDLSGKPAVILVIGVNGVGKTTSIAKLADYYTRQGKRVMLAAGDTFRAAASEQLEIWADRAGVPIVKAGEGADPAAVIFDTVKSATARGYDMVIADTAGRLHNKSNLMAELSKISRSVKKAAPEASLETLLVLDAITGQNAISQAREFCKAADATGIILTKLDGTAKGGCVVAVKQRLGLPVRFIGVGEGIDDLLPFTPEGFVEELLPREWKH